ncbi:T9SS type A sorting domain-containing protein [Algibacter mikhailovii]|uniref:T9SS type A sorting domain-containing protein n=1 Tax=Algibacter mikhailovii TaxID=425498 RepID=UPI002494A50A|nr:T9SS type A sorting domain-containing protein [Algibacter mikhailovii]
MKTTNSFLTICFFSIFIANSFGQVLPLKTSNPDDTWTLQESFSDEFNNSEIDWTKWSKTANLPNVSAWKWNNDTNVTPTMHEGEQAAAITMRHNTDNIPVSGTYFNSGCLQNVSQLPAGFVGYVEARIYGADINSDLATSLDRRRGVCPAFWLYSKFYDSKPIGEPVYTEIDVVELQQFDWDAQLGQDYITDAESNLHLVLKSNSGRQWFRPKQPDARDNQLNKYELPGAFDPTQGWHTYACEITPTQLHFYVDGIKVGRSLNNTYWSENPLQVIVSLGLRVPFVSFSNNRFQPVNPVTNDRANKNLGEIPTSMYLDYIRVWEKDNTLSVKDVQTAFTMYPNPTDGILYIDTKEEAKVTIYSTNGQQVFTADKYSASQNIDLSHLHAGLYIVQVENNNRILREKLIIK